MIPEITLTMVPCVTPGNFCPFGVQVFNPNYEYWCRKWRVQRDKETVIYGCNPDYPKHFLE